jgi:hypothetical protein
MMTCPIDRRVGSSQFFIVVFKAQLQRTKSVKKVLKGARWSERWNVTCPREDAESSHLGGEVLSQLLS